MSIIKKSFSFINSTYDKIIAIAIGFIVIGTLIWLGILLGTIPERIAAIDKQIEELIEEHPDTELVQPGQYQDVYQNLSDPFEMTASEKHMFYHEPRILCSGCRLPISVKTVESRKPCPFCDHVPPVIPLSSWEKWLKKNGLKESNAAEDQDKDGFTNHEEFIAGTDPGEMEDSPLSSTLKVEKIKRVPFKLMFKSMVIMKNKKKQLGINVGGRTIFAALGDEVGGFTLKALDEIEVSNSFGGVDRTEKIPVLIIEGQGKTIRLIKGRPHVDYFAVILFTMDNSTHTASSSQPLNIRGRKFALDKIDIKSRSVFIKAMDTGKVWVVTR